MRCPYCDSNNQTGLLYCTECCRAIYDSNLTTMLKFPRLGVIEEGGDIASSLFVAEEDYVILQPTTGANPLICKVRESDPIIVGRADKDTEPLCDVNLTRFDALKQGVSRHHLKIYHDSYAWKICDLNSTNGTRLNNISIVPNHNYPIKSGDKICLGNLTLRLYFITKVEN